MNAEWVVHTVLPSWSFTFPGCGAVGGLGASSSLAYRAVVEITGRKARRALSLVPGTQKVLSTGSW